MNQICVTFLDIENSGGQFWKLAMSNKITKMSEDKKKAE